MALPYPTKVVLPFDIATAQDMNERHANDVALADGTGLDDGAVTSSKIDFSSDIWWEELGRSSTVAGNTITATLSSPKKYLKVIARTSNSSASSGSQLLRFNGDSGSNYRVLYQDSGPSTGGTTAPFSYSDSSSSSAAVGDVRQFEYVAWDANISKIAPDQWSQGNVIVSADGRFRNYLSTQWKNTSDSITSVSISASGGTITGELIVLGHD